MTGPEHYAEAERLLRLTAHASPSSTAERADLIAAARVHAELAMVAATVRETVAYIDGDGWRKVLS